jgi:hypothetical protein
MQPLLKPIVVEESVGLLLDGRERIIAERQILST